MSANLLERVTTGPLVVEPNGYPEVFGLAVVEPAAAVVVAELKCDPRDAEAVEATRADAALFALAYGHALLLRALTMGKAERAGDVEDRVSYEVEGALYFCTLDAAGCPVLTADLRAALRKAVSP